MELTRRSCGGTLVHARHSSASLCHVRIRVESRRSQKLNSGSRVPMRLTRRTWGGQFPLSTAAVQTHWCLLVPHLMSCPARALPETELLEPSAHTAEQAHPGKQCPLLTAVQAVVLTLAPGDVSSPGAPRNGTPGFHGRHAKSEGPSGAWGLAALESFRTVPRCCTNSTDATVPSAAQYGRADGLSPALSCWSFSLEAPRRFNVPVVSGAV